MSDNDQEEDELVETLEFISKQLEEHYQLKTINKYGGQGGFGLVLFVEDINDQSQKYAIKAQSIISKTTGNINQTLLKQCKEEARIMRECKHENVVEIYCDFVLGLYHFIQMNLCYCSLSDWIMINGQRSISDQIFCKFVEQMIQGLEYLHNKDYVLRDVSVRNILLTVNGDIKFCDFGLARKYDNSLRSKVLYTSHLNGVIYYFPPEIHQAIQENKPQIKQTKEGDIWALGVCLSLLGGVPISHFSNSFHKDFKIVDAPNLSEKANQLIKEILIKDLKSRPTFNQIREHIHKIFYFLDLGAVKTLNEKVKSSETTISQTNSKLETRDNSIVSLSQSETAVVFINNKIIEKKIFVLPSNLDEQIKKAEVNVEFNFLEVQNFYQKYKSILAEEPNNIEILLFLGHVEIKLNCNYEIGESYLEKVISLQKNSIEAYLGICESILIQRKACLYNQIREYIKVCFDFNQSYWKIFYIQSWLLYECENYVLSEECLQLALNQYPKSSLLNSLHSLLLIQISGQSIQSSTEKLENAISQNYLNDPLVLSRAGFFYQYYLKEFNKASTCYKRALEICQNDLMSLFNIIILLNQQKTAPDKLEAYLNQIKSYYKENSIVSQLYGCIEKSFSEKIKYFNKSIEQDKCQVSSYIYLSQIKKSQNKIEELEEIYKKILEINPNQINSYIELGQIYFQKNEKLKAQSYFKQAQDQKNISQYDDLYLKGINCELNQQEELAMKYYNQSIEYNPYQERSYLRIIKIIQENKNIIISEAINININAIQKNPLSEDLKLSLISLYIEQKRYFEAKQIMIDLIKLQPYKPQIYEQLGIIEYRELLNKEQAIEYFNKELELSISDTSVGYLALIYFEKNEQQKAKEYLERAIEINMNNLDAKYVQANLMKQDNLIDEAIQILNEILERDQYYYKAYALLGNIYQFNKQNPKEALNYYLKCMEINKQINEMHYNVSLIYKNDINDIDKAQQFLCQYTSMNIYNYNAICELVKIYLLKNDLYNAESLLILYTMHNTQNEDALRKLSDIQIQLNKDTNAINTLEILRSLNPTRKDVLLDLSKLYESSQPQMSAQIYYLCLQQDPLNVQILQKINSFTQGSFLLKLQQEAEQEKDENKLLILLKQQQLINNKSSYNLLQKLADIQFKFHMYEDSEKTIQSMIQQFKKKGYPYLLLGKIELKVNQNYTKAIEYFQKVQDLNEESSELYLRRGYSHMQLYQMEDATKYLKKATKIVPVQPLSFLYLAQIETYVKGNYKKAMKYLQECLNKNFKVAKVYYEFGYIFEQLNYLYQAKESYEKVLELDPNFEKEKYCKNFIEQNPQPENKEFKEQCSIF
ncbi:tetratricopeptide repeat protein (macronuclear) [Tetrahymena thermophila SB210]|uniref:Tetratricopeptide repeat protein n=1 Tax=Tetrahymena thermophila (strain SB210) TaxID=312017 RepID=A4VEA7_TETTS|nr:tetratricopeptide repeat protein [Tetrahymena thermophila SB210]EDK31850.2 tetratricopeptide repeat protein [Tetrahymena thermophila SB210]|eukprot:XP_001471248.2 tetratricopeptide repeat protein [Tetrahymena thermophila SB210]